MGSGVLKQPTDVNAFNGPLYVAVAMTWATGVGFARAVDNRRHVATDAILSVAKNMLKKVPK